MTASPSVKVPTTQMTRVCAASAAAWQVSPDGNSVSGMNFFSSTQSPGAVGASTA